MAGLYASWIHGNALVAEQLPNDDSILSFTHFGWGTEVTVRQNRRVWFHIPIPTPAIHDQARLVLHKVFLLFKTENGGSIIYRHLWQANSRVTDYFKNKGGPGQAYGVGNNHLSIDSESTLDLPEPVEAWFGFSLSFLFDAGLSDGRLTVSSAGGDFLPPGR